jgi:hypothetical protein
MTKTFLQHELKSFWRSRNTGKNVAVKVVMGVLILIFILYVLAAGIYLPKILAHAFPKQDPVIAFCGIILIYYLFDLISRMQLQELPTLKVQPYLQLPVKRNSLAGYLAVTSLISAFNLLPFLLFSPFIFEVIAANSGAGAAGTFVLSILGITIFNNYLALYIKRKANLNGWIMLIATGVLVLLCMGDFVWHIYSIRDISYLFFGHLISSPALALLPLLLAALMYYVNFLYLKQNLYLEELTTEKASHKSSTEYPFLNRFGAVGDLVANEIKLILRNKRPNSAIKMSCISLFYGLLFYKNPGLRHSDYPMIFAGMFMTGVFIINYGQFMFSWQASHFDGLLVSKLKFGDFLRAKYLLFTMVSTVAFIVTIPYVYFGWRVLLIHFVMYLWNLGVNTTIILFFANRNSRRIDLSKGAAFNWEGVGGTQWLISLPLFLTPFIIYLPFSLLHCPNLGIALLAIAGLSLIITRSFWINKLEADFYQRKFTIAEGFRNK